MTYLTTEDQEFISSITRIVLLNLHDELFGVSKLAEEMGISRSALHRKIKKVKNQSVSQFIREVRLKKAKELLEQRGQTVSEVAYKVGFGSPAYFNHCYHEHFGITPGEVRKQIQPEEENDNRHFSTNESAPESGKKKFHLPMLGLLLVILFLASWFIFDKVKGTASNQDSIIVLPFKNMSGDASNDYFADGIREDILNNLYWIKSLDVVSRTTSDQYRNTEVSSREIGKKNGVRYLLEGSVRSFDGKVRVSIQLIDAKKDIHLWSDYFDRELKDVIELQGQIALQVADKMKMVLSENEIRQIEKLSTHSAKAYDYFLQARFLLHQTNSPQRTGFNASGVINSIPYYEKAIAEDSTFAEAYAGLANANMQLSAWGIIPSSEGFLKATQFSQRAIGIDSECAEAYAILGAMNMLMYRNMQKAGEMYRKSVQLNPNFATSRQWYAQYLMGTGPISEARIQVNKAVELEPFFWVVKNLDAWITYFEKDYEHSLALTLEAHDYNPQFSDNMWLFFLNYVKLSRGEETRDQLKKIVVRYSNNTIDTTEIDAAFNLAGKDGLFNWMLEVNKNRPIPCEGLNGDYFFLAWWNAILNNTDQTLYWLEENFSYKRPKYQYFNLILLHPDFEFLHNEPRFRLIIEKLGMSDYWVNVQT